MDRKNDPVEKIERGVRLDLAIAVCALLVSGLAAGASWWQARVLVTQTRVLQDQLGAQVWPYVSVTEGFRNDRVELRVANEGLGPAILGSAAATVDGVPKSNFIDILHAILGPHLLARSKGVPMGFAIDSASPGSVVRPGEASLSYSFISKRFAPALLKGYSRQLRLQICYCSILPGKCWVSTMNALHPPDPVPACPPIPSDLLHAPAMQEIFTRDY